MPITPTDAAPEHAGAAEPLLGRTDPLRFLVANRRFLLTQRLVGFDAPASPHFDSPETTAWFQERLKTATAYLEYGAGGSTFLAASSGIPFISVDSDRYFLKAVRKKIKAHGFLDERSQTYHYADIGLTGPWGRPVMFGPPSSGRAGLFSRYSDPPAPCQARGFAPDLVLIDGRFRISCALKLARLMKDRDDWTILVDDYVERPHYHLLEGFLRLQGCVGRMAVFARRPEQDLDLLDAAIARFETVLD
jgi:hypothetical protein